MKTPDDGLKMTKEQIVKALRACVSPCIECRDCPFRGAEKGCRKEMMEAAADYIERTVFPTNAKIEETPGVLGEIMGHYKKPLVTISFQEMEDGEE